MSWQSEREGRTSGGLLDNLTPERRALLAQRLARAKRVAQAPAPPSEFVQLQAGEGVGRTPFFCVHPAGGNVFCYATLARALGRERSFYAIPAAALRESFMTQPALELLAARYVAALRRAHPAETYYLGGWSMGGVVAFEMARQLGARVALLALFDAKIPTPAQRRVREDDAALLLNFAIDLGCPVEKLRALRAELSGLGPEAQLRLLFERAREAGLLPAGADLRAVTRLLEVFKLNVRAMCGYTPRPYAGRVHLFRAEAQRQADADGLHGWGESAALLEVHDLPGDHYSIMREPHVSALASGLRACLRRADEGQQ